MIHPIKQDCGTETYCISSHQVWRPGSFACRKSASIALRTLDDETILTLQDAAIARGGLRTITLEDILALGNDD